jgi:hypothetical protein
MAGQLQVNTETITDLASNLATIHRMLQSAEADSNDLVGMIPHDRLASTVHDFADLWDRRRTELIEQIDVLRQKADTTAGAFGDVDGELANAIASEG